MLLHRLIRLLRPSPALPGIDRLVVGLGNPGQRYSGTRHNVGYMVLDAVAREAPRLSHVRLSDCDVSIGRIGEVPKVALAKPLTFMNRSGQAVESLLARAKIGLPSVLVVSDDLNLPLGSIRFRRGGSDGGHNGLKSIAEHIGPEFARLRVGIGPLPAGVGMVDFVLGYFDNAETPPLAEAVARACEGVVTFVDGGIDAAMSRYNSATPPGGKRA